MSQIEFERDGRTTHGVSSSLSPGNVANKISPPPKLEEIDEAMLQEFAPALPLQLALGSPRDPTAFSPSNSAKSPARTPRQFSPRLETVNEKPEIVSTADDSNDGEDGGESNWHDKNPLPDSPPKLQASLAGTTNQHILIAQSIQESLMSRNNVINSRKLKSQFLIELAVRFAMLSNLKVLDQGIDARHLEIGEKLGGGTFGTVCKAKLRGLDVAVKQLNSGTLTPESTLALKIEVEILSKLRHPNIVLFIGLSLTATFAAMVTEWCERGCLFDLLKSPTDRLYTKTFLKLALDVARGMWYLHSSEKLLIIHRDLKSPNILISLAGSAKVADFGLAVMHERKETAKPEDDGHEFHGNAGTPQWMAPEIMRREAYGQKVDVYSFGILLSELLTRRMPYRDKFKDMDFKEAVMERNERPTLPAWTMSSKCAVSESHKLGELVMECTEMMPERRPTFSQVIDILESLFFTLENNDIRAFEDFDLPRWSEALDCGDFDELVHASNELSDVLEEVSNGKAHLAEEKRSIFTEQARNLINMLMCRIGFSKAPKLKEEGAAYDFEPLPEAVMSNLVRSVDYLILFLQTAQKPVVLNRGASPSAATPSIKPYQVEALVDLFLDATNEKSDYFPALIRLLRSDLVAPMALRQVLESKLDARIEGKKLPALVNTSESEVSLSQSSSFVSQSSTIATEGNETKNDSDIQDALLSKCKRYNFALPAKYHPQVDRLEREAEALRLEQEITNLENLLKQRRQQLKEIHDSL